MAKPTDFKLLQNDLERTLLLNFRLDLKIKGVDVFPQNVISLHVREWVFDVLPRIDIQMFDFGVFSDKYPLEENDEIEISLSIDENQPSIVKNIFLVNDVSIENINRGENIGTVTRITGLLKNNNMYWPLINLAFNGKNSDLVIKTVANQVGLTPDIKIQCNDTQTWLQIQQSNADFIKSVADRAFIADNDAIFVYTTRNSKLTYTSLNTELKKNSKFQAVYDPIMAENAINDNPENSKGKSGQVKIYLDNYEIKNMSGLVNKTCYNGSSINYYDKNENILVNNTSDIHPLTQYSLKNASSVGKIVSNKVYGIINNVHNNYFKSMLTNDYIKRGFFSNLMTIIVKPQVDIHLFDVIDVLILSPDELSIDNVHSGLYIIGGITHHVSDHGMYDMILILFRNGFNKPTFDDNLVLKNSKG